MQLYFIRHSQSENNALWDRISSGKGRNQDPGLTETGVYQAEYLASFLRDAGSGHAPDGGDIQNTQGFGLTHLYTSLMVRAVETGAIVSKALGLPLFGWIDLHEGGGIYLNDEKSGEPVGLAGNPRSFFQKNFPQVELKDDFGEEGWWNRPFETRPQRRERARRVITYLLQQHGDQQERVALFSHAGFYNHFMSALLNITERQDLAPSQASIEALTAENVILSAEREAWFTMNNAAITRIDFTHDEIKICYQNRLDYLPPSLIT